MKVVKRVVKLVTNAEAKAITGEDSLGNGAPECDYEDMARALGGFGLTPFEICNIINVRPRGLACLQTIVEEMAERLDSGQMAEILEIAGGPGC